MINFIKKIYAQTIWAGSVIGLLGLMNFILYLDNGKETLRIAGTYLFLSGILVLVVSIIIAFVLNVHFIAENED